MAYKIALASSDGNMINQSFGTADAFWIYDVQGPGEYTFSEKRICPAESKEIQSTGGSCGTGCGNGQGGCGNGRGSAKVKQLGDVRCLICTKVGFQAQKQLERQAVTVFDVSCTIKEALDRITFYFDKVDRHQSFRGIAQKNFREEKRHER